MKSNIKIFENMPDDFSAQVEVAAIYVNVNDKILLLQLSDQKMEKGLWGVPAGKLESHEEPLQAAKRELFEETGLRIDPIDRFHALGALYIRKPELDYVYHLFGVQLDTMPALALSAEHRSHAWVSREEAKTFPLVNGAKQALDTYYRRIKKKGIRTGASVNVYLVLRKESDILLSLRENTGYFDGHYGLIAGHVEDSESATTAMIREAYEESGIRIQSSCLKIVHVMHRQTNRFNIDLFFECHEWKGNIVNREHEKCAALTFFPIKQLPANTIDYIRDALQAISSRNFYSEYGWRT